MTILESALFESPIGKIVVAVRDGRLCSLNFADHRPAQIRWLERRFGTLSFRPATDPAAVITALSAYFEGNLHAFDGLELDAGGTLFQTRVWSELRKVPAGCTISYGQLARAIGSPHAARAVGIANAHNPIAIVVPCHRTIGSDGRLVGYGGGLDRKQWLLQHESVFALPASDSRLQASAGPRRSPKPEARSA